MKSLNYTKYGGTEVLHFKTVPQPTANDDEIVVKVHYTTVNRTDCANVSAPYFIMRLILGIPKPKKQTTGTDFAGEIISVGKNISEYKKGDRIFGFNDQGACSHAEYIVLNNKSFFNKIPDNVSYQSAVAGIEGGHYAYNMVNKVRIEPHHKVLVNGATGAIGSACIQLLNTYKVDITAVCPGNYSNKIMNLGANKIIDYTKEDFTKLNDQYDFIFDAVGKSTFGKCKPILKPKGIYISSELGPYSQNLFYVLFTHLFCKKKVVFPFPNDIPRSLELISELSSTEKYLPLVERTYKFRDIIEAFKYVNSGKKIGSVLIEINDNR